jgi:hypothetical protein
MAKPKPNQPESFVPLVISLRVQPQEDEMSINP